MVPLHEERQHHPHTQCQHPQHQQQIESLGQEHLFRATYTVSSLTTAIPISHHALILVEAKMAAPMSRKNAMVLFIHASCKANIYCQAQGFAMNLRAQSVPYRGGGTL